MRTAASLSVESHQMTRTEKFACEGCDRTFLTRRARRRHYEWNPEHAETAVTTGGAGAARADAGSTRKGAESTRTDAEAARADAEAPARAVEPPDDRWVEFDDRFETFLALGDGGGRIDVEYRPDESAVVVRRPDEPQIDVIAVGSLAGERLRWTFDGAYLTLSVPKRTR